MSTNCVPCAAQSRFRIPTLALVAVACAVLGLGCSKRTPPPAGPSDSNSSGWTLELTVSPDSPRMVQPATFKLHIADRARQPIGNARVTGTLNMALMDMGKVDVNFEPIGNGDYTASVMSFDMSGPWQLSIEATQATVRVNKVFQFTVSD